MMWLTMIARNWQLALLALMTCAFTLSIAHGRYLSAKLDERIAVIESMKREAENFHSRSEAIAGQTNEQHIALVEQAKKTAYTNYLKKYGNNAACGISVRLPNMPAGIDQADSTGEFDEASADHVPDPARALAEQCAETTVMVTEWQQWARDNDLEVK